MLNLLQKWFSSVSFYRDHDRHSWVVNAVSVAVQNNRWLPDLLDRHVDRVLLVELFRVPGQSPINPSVLWESRDRYSLAFFVKIDHLLHAQCDFDLLSINSSSRFFFYLYDFIRVRWANLGIVIFENVIENCVLVVLALYQKKNTKKKHFDNCWRFAWPQEKK